MAVWRRGCVHASYPGVLLGSEAAPHPHKFNILLHGTRGTQTLPKFGIKTVAMTDGSTAQLVVSGQNGRFLHVHDFHRFIRNARVIWSET